MQKTLLSIFALACFTFTTAKAQLELPLPSPNASVSATPGLTEITIDYSSPGVKERTIWGELVPFGEVWRAGANQATKVTFSQEVTIGGTKVPAGSYSLFIQPEKEGEWSVMLNTDATASTGQRKAENDIVVLKVAPTSASMKERLAYTITDFDDASATINMEWEKIQLPIKVMLGTKEQAAKNIENAVGGMYRTHLSAARYHLGEKQYDEGLKHANKAIEMRSDYWFNHWVKAELLKEKGMPKEALAAAKKAKELGDKEPERFFYKERVDKAVNEWKAK